jgi:hypothetical protein
VGQGAARQDVTAWSITGINNFPIPVWADAKGKFFGFVFFPSWLPEQYASEHVRLTEAQAKAMAAQAPILAKALVKVPPGAVAFTHVREVFVEMTNTVPAWKGIEWVREARPLQLRFAGSRG